MNNKADVIERLCKLVTRVGAKVFDSQLEHDCFCDSSINTDTFRMNDEVIKFIEDTVHEAIANFKLKQKNVHTEHCCFFHGCKYGEDNICPVVNGLQPQSFPCEDCN